MNRFCLIIYIWVFQMGAISSQSYTKDPVVAHRGAWKSEKFPENSIAALRHALKLGCMASEFDVRITADDILVINHDPEYHGLPIEQTNFNELKKILMKNGESIPTLEQYLLEGSINNYTTRLVLEIKPSEVSKERGRKIARQAGLLVQNLGLNAIVDFISFDIDILKELITTCPDISTQYLNGDLSPTELKKLGVDGLDYHFKVFYKHPEWITEAKALGLILNVWTVNDADDMAFFLEKEFDLITTNEPELLYQKLRKSEANPQWHLVWRDEFSYRGLPDTTRWNYDVGGHGWGNNEKQFYLANSLENAAVNQGKLHITALQKAHENAAYTSAKLTTYQRFLMQYGKIEVRAKLPAGKGTWPAIWMLPESIKTNTENWPLCGEIDIMEHVGKDPNMVHTSLHSELYNHIKGTQVTHFDKLSDVSGSFHTYGIEWDEKSIRFIIDGQLYFESLKGQNGHISTNEGWPFDKPYYLILNLAIGGNWGGEIDPNIFPSTMEIDFVRMYKRK